MEIDFSQTEPHETTASYDTKCPCCGEMIFEGDKIKYIDDDEEWCHAECDG